MPLTPGDHPEDLLEAYALGALEEDELADVESHVDSCAECARALAGLLEATAGLASVAHRASPPPQLLSQVMEAVEDLPPVFVPAAAWTNPRRR